MKNNPNPRKSTTMVKSQTAPQKSKLNQIVTLEIEKMTLGGDGLARLDGAVYFVPFTAPQDIVECRITECKKNFFRAEILKFISHSPLRTSPQCPVYEKCGGCNWQHLSYSNQITQKELILKEQFKKLQLEDNVWRRFTPSPEIWNYRNRIQLQCKEGKIGFHGRRTHDVIEIDHCPIASKALNEELKKVLLKKGSLPPRVEIYESLKNEVSFRDTSLDSTEIGFSQVNNSQNIQLISWVKDQIQKEETFEEIFDLYGGSGNFAFPICEVLGQGSLKTKIYSVEMSEAAVKSGRESQFQLISQKENHFKNIQFYVSDVLSFLKRKPLEENTLVLLDPPRNGCDIEIINLLSRSKVRKILYISCNPSSLVRDLEILLKSQTFKISSVQGFDMFPQTDHIETAVELTRIN